MNENNTRVSNERDERDTNQRYSRSGNSNSQRGNNYKKKGKSNTRSRRDERIDSSSVSTNGQAVINDPNWYFSNAELAKQSTQIAFNQFLGLPFTLSDEQSISTSIPSLMKIVINPSAGFIDPMNPMSAGINMQGYRLYTRLSSINAKTTNYAPQDLTCFMLAMGNMLSTISLIRRFFGVAFCYNQRNRVYPKVILEALGIEADNFMTFLADYRLQFNTLINTVNKIPIPSNIDYLVKSSQMFDNIYLDSETAMAQSYALTPHSCWVFNEAYNEEGSGLTTRALPGMITPALFSEWYNVLKAQVNALMTSTTLNYVYSDILNLAQKENVALATINVLPENYSVVPAYNKEALLQINNMRFIYVPWENAEADLGTTPSNDVVPDVEHNALKYYPAFRGSTGSLEFQQILNFQNGSPDAAEIIEATRFSAISGGATLKDKLYYNVGVAMGDWYACFAYIYTNEVPAIWDANNKVSADGLIAPSPTLLSLYDKFDCAPHFFAMTDATTLAGVVGDVDFFTTVSHEYLKRVNDLAMQGLFELR